MSALLVIILVLAIVKVPLMAHYFVICAESFWCRIFLLNCEGFVEQDTSESVAFQLAELQLKDGYRRSSEETVSLS